MVPDISLSVFFYRRSLPHVRLLALLALLVATTSPLVAQSLTRPERDWRSVSTEHFSIHYPAEMSAWAEPVARRLESIADAVNAMVGNAPAKKVTVLVEDPANVSNGFAVPLLETPVIFFWPTPPVPSPTFGAYREWGEILAVHEYAHIAHLTFPSRNPTENLLWRFLPTRVGPVARKAPAWVIEGYATYIEGKLTGNGRPNSAARAAVLRQWALEGKLPPYQQLNSAQPFLGGAMRYLVGSAFLEWLVERKGEQSLTHLWRRMSARQRRDFGEAFAGVYGALPDELYGRFFVEVMAEALDAEREIKGAGVVEGELVQHVRWSVGAPAISKDGQHVAISLGRQNAPSRLVIWKTEPDPVDSASVRRLRRMLERDTLDVAPFDSFPRPRRAVATLHPSAGFSYESPRWFPDGERILVSRDVPLGDGAVRPDLFIWNFRSGGIRRLTTGAAIRTADPSPDGNMVAAVRCRSGICDLVLIDVASRQMRVLAPGTPSVTWHRPRFSPDGRSIAAALHRDGRWLVALVDVADGRVRPIDLADGVARHSPSWGADGRRLVVVSERGGVPNLEFLEIDGSGTRAITRTVGAVMSPEVNRADGSVWFLSLHAKGYDVRRVPPGVAAGSVVALSSTRFPVAPPSRVRGDTFPPRPIAPRAYGLGPRAWRVLPGGLVGPDGNMALLSFTNVDPIGRLGVVVQGGIGDKAAWRGGSLAAESRRRVLHLTGSAWYTEQEPSAQPAGAFTPLTFDAKYTGGAIGASFGRSYARLGFQATGGASVGVLDGHQLNNDVRQLATGELRARLSLDVGMLRVTPVAWVHASRGTTAEEAWSRGIAGGSLVLGSSRQLRVDGAAGHVTPDAGSEFGRAYEQFLIGGNVPPFADRDVHPERIALPGVPQGLVTGPRFALWRGTLSGWLPVDVALTYVAAGDTRTDWKRVVSAERSFAVQSLGFVRLPAVRIRGGGALSLDEADKRKVRGYFSLVYEP